MFRGFGGTLFSTPSKVSMKEVHLDNGTLLGAEIIVEGEVVNTGKYTTHLVLNDETARMLVVLTGIADADLTLKDKKPKMLRILGTVERGKKGFPFIQAKALNPINMEKS